MKIRSMIPNGVTMLNLFMGFFAIEKILEGRFEEAVWWVALGLFCDALDGNIARIFKVESELGKELDSLGDLVSFVVAPSMLVYHSWPYPKNIWMYIAVYFFLGAGALRLARFNINAARTVKGYFVGLPTPGTAIVVMTVTVGLQKLGIAANPYITLLFFSWLVVLGVLMVSNICYPKITIVRLSEWKGLLILGGLGLGFGYYFFPPELGLAVPFIIYVFYGIVTWRANVSKNGSGA